jgi:hypothetical protein
MPDRDDGPRRILRRRGAIFQVRPAAAFHCGPVLLPSPAEEVPMKRFFVPMIALALMLSGCLQAKIDTTIAGDGSGTLSMTYSMSAEVAKTMEELAALGGEKGMGEEMSLMPTDIDRAQFEKACRESGVTLKKFEESSPEGGKKIDMLLAFKNLDGLNRAMSEGMKGKNEGSISIFKRADGNYVLRTVKGEASVEEEPAEEPVAEETESPDASIENAGKMMELMGKLMGSMSEMDVSMRITVPGDVIQHNAPKLEGRTLIWEINPENMMTAGASMGEPEIVFSGKGLKIDAPMETTEEGE